MPREKILCGKEEIFRVAINIVDRDGIEALSVRSIAKDLSVSPMTIYNYVDNLQSIKKQIVIEGFDRLYNYVFSELSKLNSPVDKTLFCKTVAMAVFRFSIDNNNIFVYMFSEGGKMFSNDAEVRPFFNFISTLTKRAKATQKHYTENQNGYKLLEVLIFSVAYQMGMGVRTITEQEYEALIDYYIQKCIA